MVTESNSGMAKELDDIYTPLSVAKREIWRRWNDKELQKKVEDFLGGDIPEFLRDKPRAVIGRNIASPNIDFSNFVELSKVVDLDFACIEYLNDKFVARNKDKYHLCRVFIYSGIGKNGGDKLEASNIVNFDGLEGKRFNEIETVWGDSIVNFHHNILEECFFKGISDKAYDLSEWFSRKGKTSQNFYASYLSLFIRNGILFENYSTGKNKDNFYTDVLLPSIKKLEDVFGLKPIIIPIEAIEDGMNLRWYCYMPKVKEILKSLS